MRAMNVSYTSRSRFLLTFVFYTIHMAVVVAIQQVLLGQPVHLNMGYQAGAAAVNSLLAVFLFGLLNRFKIRN